MAKPRDLSANEIAFIKDWYAMCKIVRNRGVATAVTIFVGASISIMIGGMAAAFYHLIMNYGGK